jgi:undecaprenyl diphosphate synthase
MENSATKKIPRHIAIIMDGNRRWARERNLPTLEGHLKGYEKAKKAPDWFFARGVKQLSLFSFSTENWNRSREEVNYLMKLLELAIVEERDNAMKKGYRVLFSGRLDELPANLPDSCRRVMEETRSNPNGIINICVNYGGRKEMVDAIKKMFKDGVAADDIKEENLKKYLYHPELEDPDVIIRTSGEQRLSGFLLWQSAYSEMIFLKKYWPDFEEHDASDIIKEYAARMRRFGAG